jgi:hypothetical protein
MTTDSYRKERTMVGPYDASVKRTEHSVDLTDILCDKVLVLKKSIREFEQWQWEVDERIALLNRRVAQLEDVAVYTLRDKTDER